MGSGGWGGGGHTQQNTGEKLQLRFDSETRAVDHLHRADINGTCSHRLCSIILPKWFVAFLSHRTGCGSTPSNMWSFVAFIWTCCFLEDTWAPLKRRHGLLSIRKAVGCFRFDEQEVHMHSTKNVNETHSSQFLMETSLDLGIRRWREMGSPPHPPCTPPQQKKKTYNIKQGMTLLR